MAENTKGRLLLEKKDFVAVVDDDGNELSYQVPKHWGADQLAAGVKKKSGKGKADKADGGGSGDEAPSGNASREDWEAYARKQGAGDADLVDGDGEPLGRDAIREKYAPKS